MRRDHVGWLHSFHYRTNKSSWPESIAQELEVTVRSVLKLSVALTAQMQSAYGLRKLHTMRKVKKCSYKGTKCYMEVECCSIIVATNEGLILLQYIWGA